MTTITGVVLLTVMPQVGPSFFTRDRPLRDRVTLSLESDKSSYFVGEAVHLKLSLHNFSDTVVVGAFTLEPIIGKSRVFYRKAGTKFKELRHLDANADSVQNVVRLSPDETYSREVIVVFDPTTRLPLLNEVGTYEFRTDYQDADGEDWLLQSNILSISAVDVPADQRDALAAYRSQGLAYFSEFDSGRNAASPEQVQAAADFLDKFPRSVYASDVRNGLYSSLTQRVGTGFGSPAEAALLKKIEASFTDTGPPSLSVSASPSVLFPPNHKLVPITVTVNVSDDVDPHPEVKLESITCIDEPSRACGPDPNFEGAAFGTDDRQFELLATRPGDSKGRVYTITYSATDAAGHKATATTTVTVPHDQGKK